ncbi:hypothetical protein LCGC14_1495760 [marine sediment metagenome]|uniref:Glycosyl transferase family 1 domain-containing protein n=1 Tax=marine sediment metagenome TaxID=412755 RepID=A0A0F9M721_9ZZZZ|nr:glycosyltransferase family 1 protein [Candidatus Aminicenantes bacterium]
MKRKKILLASPLPPPYSGYEKTTQYILKSKVAKEFNIIHLDTSNKRSNVERGRFDVLNILRTLRTIINILRLLIIYRPEIAIIPLARNRAGFLKWSTFILIASLFQTKIVSRLGGADFDKFYQPSSDLMKKYIKFVLKHINIIIVNAKRLKSQFKSLVNEKKIRVVYNAIDVSEFNKGDYKSNKKYLGEEIKVLYMGHISKAKGALVLLKAIPTVTKEMPNAKFLFAGDIIKTERNILHIDNPPDMEKEINFIIKEENIQSYIKFLGIIDGQRKIDTLSIADIFVFPSYSEGFPYVILEAMRAGLPIVATPVGALPEVFKNRENILFVISGNSLDLAKKILIIIKNPRLREVMKKNNQKLIKEKFNLDRFGNEMIAIFNELQD